MEVVDEQRVDFLLPGTTRRLELEYPARLVQPSAWVGHIPFALWLIGALKPRIVVELGVHTGNSYCAFLQAVDTLGIETRCFGIDHLQGAAGHDRDEVYNELRAYHDPRYGTFSTLLRSSFAEALAYFSDGSIDLLHIDGVHTYEGVAAEFQSWLPKVSSRGVALFHDINVRERGFGIWRFWEELTSRYPHFEFLHSHRLGILYLGSEPLSGPIKALFAEQAAGEREGIQRYFTRLGISVVERLPSQMLAPSDFHPASPQPEKADRQKGRVAALETELAAAKSDLEEAKKNLAAAKLQPQIRNSMMRQHLAVMARLQRELIRANLEKDSYQTDVMRLQRELLETNLQKDCFHADVARLQQQLHEANLLKDSYETDTVRLQQEILAADDEKYRLQRCLLNANLERDGCHAEVALLRQELLTSNVEKDFYQRQLVDVLKSRCWRLTGPFRWIVNGSRRLLGQDRQCNDRPNAALTKS